MTDETVIECRCCNATYTLAQWTELPPAKGGLIWDDELSGMHHEARNCECGNTLFLELVPLDEVLG